LLPSAVPPCFPCARSRSLRARRPPVRRGAASPAFTLRCRTSSRTALTGPTRLRLLTARLSPPSVPAGRRQRLRRRSAQRLRGDLRTFRPADLAAKGPPLCRARQRPTPPHLRLCRRGMAAPINVSICG